MTLLLTRRDVADLVTIDDCITAVENAFRLLGRGEVPRPAIAGVHGNGGAFTSRPPWLGIDSQRR
jgi:ornithine cyclodeaminase/alanine dehydrogenase-like protein (mu-crystallin family)